MGTDLDHLRPDHWAALERVVDIIREAFALAVSRATQPWKRHGEIHRIVLFGPLAGSGGLVADTPALGEPAGDYTVMIVVSHRDLVAMPKYWRPAEDAIRYDPAIDQPVTMLVHACDDVTSGIARGDGFWSDIARSGIALYERAGAAPVPTAPVALPQSAGEAISLDGTRERTAETAHDVLRGWTARIDDALDVARYCRETDNRPDTAFMLHQAAERAYVCHLLVRGGYAPRSHNLEFLRSLAEATEPDLAPCWPRAVKRDRRRFDLIKRAYLDARYAPEYAIDIEDFDAIAANVRALREAVTALCSAWIDKERLVERRLPERHRDDRSEAHRG